MAISYNCDKDIADESPYTDSKLPNSVKYLIGHNIDLDIVVLRM